jgi:hypothetical protein
VAGEFRHVHIQTEQHRETSPPWVTPVRMLRRVDMADFKDVSDDQQCRCDDVR